MSLPTSVPNYPVNQDVPFLLQVKFDDSAKRLAEMACEIDRAAASVRKADEQLGRACGLNEGHLDHGVTWSRRVGRTVRGLRGSNLDQRLVGTGELPILLKLREVLLRPSANGRELRTRKRTVVDGQRRNLEEDFGRTVNRPVLRVEMRRLMIPVVKPDRESIE